MLYGCSCSRVTFLLVSLQLHVSHTIEAAGYLSRWEVPSVRTSWRALASAKLLASPDSAAIQPARFMATHRIGIIGGTGLYQVEGLTRQKWVKVKTPFGPPSDELLTGELSGREVVFLPRHARGHRLLPGELNHRANIWALKQLGVAWIVSVSAVGSLQKRYHPCDLVLVDQFLDRTKRSFEHTFFGRGIVAHVAFAHPICEELRRLLLKAARAGAMARAAG